MKQGSKIPLFFPRPASKSNDSSRTGVEGAGPLANERRRRNFSRFALRHARSHLGPGPALAKLALDHSSPPQDGRPWTTLGDIGPTLDRVVQGWTNAEIAALIETRHAASLVRTGTCGHSESAGPLVSGDLDAGIAKQIRGVSPGTVPGPRSSLHIAQFSRSRRAH